MTDGMKEIIADFERSMEGTPDYALHAIGLAELALRKKDKLQALELARKALAAACGNAEVLSRATALLTSLVPGYHVPMMNDARRNAVWDRALRDAIRPGMHVLEIGTGGGMLALMAARAGAAKVTTCERDPIVAAIAREIVERNGYGDRIEIVGKGSQDIGPDDLAQPADLLFCDIFGDRLLDFDPLPALADARRLLVPGAPVIPATGSIRVALADWGDYTRRCLADRAADFDITPFAEFASAGLSIAIGDPRLTVRSTDAEAFHFDFGAATHPHNGQVELELEINAPGPVNGIVQWIRLELGGGCVHESRPVPGAVSFSSPRYSPMRRPVLLDRGDRFRVAASFRGKHLTVWPAQ
jgi:SAM-dependent methyltransferase